MDNRVEPNAEVMGAQYFRLIMSDGPINESMRPEWVHIDESGEIVVDILAYLDQKLSPIEDMPVVDPIETVVPEVMEVETIIVSVPESAIVVEPIPDVEIAGLPSVEITAVEPILILDSTSESGLTPIPQPEPIIVADLTPDPSPVQNTDPIASPWYSRLWTLLNTDIIVLAKRAYSWWVSH